MNNIKNMKIGQWMLAFAAALLFTACSDWTEVEPVSLNESGIEKQNPELYAKYLENLRAYKASEHKVTIAWFNRANKATVSRADHVEVLPDSIDIVSVVHPDVMGQADVDEMAKVRREKGTRFVLNIDYDAIRLAYDNMVADKQEQGGETEGEETVIVDFSKYLTDTLGLVLPLVKDHGYDGVNIAFRAKRVLHMTDEEKEEYLASEVALWKSVREWLEGNGEKMLLFEGLPQNVTDKLILEKCRYIIVPCMSVSNAVGLTYNVRSANVEDVPSDRYVVAVETVSLDKDDVKTGYWSDGSRAVIGASKWVASLHDGYTVAGLGVKNVNNDYFNVARVYPYIRDAIVIMNPSPKK